MYLIPDAGFGKSYAAYFFSVMKGLAMLVKDWMMSDIILCELDETVQTAANRMVEEHASAVMVVKNDHLVGIFTEHDLVKVIARELNPKEVLLSEVMTADPDTVDENEDAMDVQRELMDSNYRHKPVVSHGKPVGLVSLGSRMSS